MLVACAGLLVIITLIAMMPTLLHPPTRGQYLDDVARIKDGTYTDGEHVAMLRRSVREQTRSVIAHTCLGLMQMCFLLSARTSWLAVVFLGFMAMSGYLVYQTVERRRYFQHRLKEVEDQVVLEARVDEEAERILRRGD